MQIDFLPLLSFVVITTYTPGPNNITSASMGILFGYKKSLRYLAGIASGFFLIMLVCSWVSAAILRVLPAFETYLKIIGALYILWLAYHTLKASYSFEEDRQAMMGFSKGFFLQLFNPKVIVYGLTLYTTFLVGITHNPLALTLSALAFAGLSFTSISIWALFGAAIRTYMSRPRLKQGIHIALSLMLVYTAVELSGVFNYF